jgi:hypothetical protein
MFCNQYQETLNVKVALKVGYVARKEKLLTSRID